MHSPSSTRFLPQARTNMYVTMLFRNAGGNGGGVAVRVDMDSQASVTSPCYPTQGVPTSYWPYVHGTTISITDSAFVSNTAGQALAALLSIGGGLYGGPGGAFVVSNCTFLGNHAGAVGGGLGFGTNFGSSLDTCALQLIDGNVIANNTAAHGSAQLHMDCSADVLVSDTWITLSSVGSQVCVCYVLVVCWWCAQAAHTTQ